MSNSIFSKVVGMSRGENQRIEDVFTEIFNKFLLYQEDISWLLKIFDPEINIEVKDFTSSTQVNYDALDNHPTSSRIDVVIKNPDTLIFIESKIDSEEGDGQLTKYSEILQEERHTNNKYLLYITKNYEKKEISFPNFRQTTWKKIYSALKSNKFKPKPGVELYLEEMLTFMEENKMDQPILKIENLVALKYYRDTTKFLEEFERVGDECFNNKIQDDTEISKIVKKKLYKRNETYNPKWEFLYEREFTIQDLGLPEIRIGYCLDVSKDVRPLVYVESTIKELKDKGKIPEGENWKSEDWDNSSWGAVKALLHDEYFNSEDQFKEIKTFFEKAIVEAFKFVKEQLPKINRVVVS